MNARRRDRRNADLERYPGLYIDQWGTYYVRKRGQHSLGTKDREEAIKLYTEIKAVWDAEKPRRHIAQRRDYFPTYVQRWIERELPNLQSSKGARKGRALSKSTRSIYRTIALRLAGKLQRPVGEITSRRLRGVLAEWRVDRPSYYNAAITLASVLFESAVADGLLDANPAMGIKRVPTKPKAAAIPPEHLTAIFKAEPREDIREAWQLIYLLSCNPVDAFKLRPDSISRRDGHVYVDFDRQKTGTAQTIYEPLGGDLDATISWWEARRKRLYPLAPTLLALGRGRPMRTQWLSLRFKAAVERAGLPAEYQMRMLRPRALTDEALRAGQATDKGGHKSAAMREHYVRERVPMVARNTLTRIG